MFLLGQPGRKLSSALPCRLFRQLRQDPFQNRVRTECSCLIANSIIFYNSSILSRLLEHQERMGDMQAADATKKVSPIAWQHINLHGRYEFLKQLDPINVGAIIRELTKIPVKLYLFAGIGKKPNNKPWPALTNLELLLDCWSVHF
jgi:hypothetical protein